MRDIRILTLFKQHYLDKYKIPLKCQFSCLGYYDGINVKHIKNVDPKLYDKKSNSPISEIWYGLSNSAETIDGRTSRQDIGLFRSLNETTKDEINVFWEEHIKMPFFSVAFLQLKNAIDYYPIACYIEKQFKRMVDEDVPVKFDLKTYYTLDNADLVVLFHSNSLKKIFEIAEKIKAIPEITYCHTIVGVSDKYLEKFEKERKKWNGYLPLTDEEIKRICIKVVTSGTATIYEILKQKMPDCEANSIKFSRLAGHEDVLIEIEETNVKTLFRLLVPNGFSTHQNDLYGECVYNIETSIILQSVDGKKITVDESSERETNDRSIWSWFIDKIYKYRAYQEAAWNTGDVSLYSYYQALIRTLNLLVQFEKFEMSEDIFYLLFPSFELFDKQLDKAVNMEKKEPGNMETIKKCMCDFVDSVNSVIYHIIHTDQMFLMIPGYSGTSFAIPIKLCLYYSWFIKKVVEILNDETGNEYQCILVPTLGARPMTSLIGMGLPPASRLIKIDLSQRMLYMPRHLMLILSHEVAHYVGNSLRLRSKRLECIIRTLACLLGEGIIPADEHAIDDIANTFRTNKHNIQVILIKKLQDKLKIEGNDKYHASDIKVGLKKACKQLLSQEHNLIRDEIYKISTELHSILKPDSWNYLSNMEKVCQYQQKYDNNRKEILSSGIIDEIVEILVDIYCEVFSDVVAVTLLDVDMDVFEETFRVSEGVKLKITSEQTESVLRRELINHILYNKAIQGNLKIDNGRNSGFEQSDRLINEMFAFDMTIEDLKEYTKECRENLKSYISKSQEQMKNVQEIREFFNIFTGKKESSCKEIYDLIQEKICVYEDTIKKMYKKIRD